jgi:DNA-directed RNA polymerase alpha subunit
MSMITAMEEIMTAEQTTTGTSLASLAEQGAATGNWWTEEAQQQHNDLELSTHVLRALDNAGITTVEQLKAAGSLRLSKLDGIGKGGMQEIINLLRALDRQNGGASDNSQGQARVRGA